MFSWLRRHGDAPRPPLAGRLIGLAVGVLLLAGSVHLALGVIEALATMLVPFVAVAIIHWVMFGRRHHK
jgi:hypothetical protein